MKIFKEKQRFSQTWLIALLVINAIIAIIIITNDFFKKETMNLNNYLFTLVIIIICSSLIFLFKLKTRIDETGVSYQFIPFHLSYKKILWEEINYAYVRKYDAISEYGGWGLKTFALWKSQKGKAINVSGDIGIQLELANGTKLLIGTKQEEQAKQVLKTYQNKTKNIQNEEANY